MRSSGARGGCLHCEAARQPDRWEEEGFKTATSFYMQGREVFKFAVSEVPQIIKDLSEKFNCATREDFRSIETLTAFVEAHKED